MTVVEIYKRNSKTAEPVKLGEVRYDDVNDVTFHGLGKMEKSLKRIVHRGKVLTPSDGFEYMQALPYYLRGDYLWASKPRRG